MEPMPKRLAILLAVYNPPVKWLTELLDSLNAQTYPNLCLYVRDDASASPAPVEELLHKHITHFPWIYRKNEINLGSNGTFEALVRDCSEKDHYIAFCDQDDIWLPDKLKNSVELLEQNPLRPALVCADMRIINGDGQEIAPDMEHHRRRHVFLRGEGLAYHLIFRNFASGCTMVAERSRILSYLPFPDGIVHDHYIAFRAACEGAIDYLAEPQMLYRVYGQNQTGVMTGVFSKEDYNRRRIEVFAHRLEVFAPFMQQDPELPSVLAWCDARRRNYRREKGSFRSLFRLRSLNPSTTLFELIALRLPSPLFRLAVRMIQRRMI